VNTRWFSAIFAVVSTSTQQRRIGRFSTWQAALLLLALVAANAQQLIAQTHWHTVAIAQVETGSAPAPAAPAGVHDDCFLCQIASHAGAIAPPTALHLAAAAGDVLAVGIPQVTSLVFTPQPAHAWQSRGPPTV
jgi:hypothetical protein